MGIWLTLQRAPCRQRQSWHFSSHFTEKQLKISQIASLKGNFSALYCLFRISQAAHKNKQKPICFLSAKGALQTIDCVQTCISMQYLKSRTEFGESAGYFVFPLPNYPTIILFPLSWQEGAVIFSTSFELQVQGECIGFKQLLYKIPRTSFPSSWWNPTYLVGFVQLMLPPRGLKSPKSKLLNLEICVLHLW